MFAFLLHNRTNAQPASAATHLNHSKRSSRLRFQVFHWYKCATFGFNSISFPLRIRPEIINQAHRLFLLVCRSSSVSKAVHSQQQNVYYSDWTNTSRLIDRIHQEYQKPHRSLNVQSLQRQNFVQRRDHRAKSVIWEITFHESFK